MKNKYLFYALVLFIVEVFIGTFVKDRFIRPFGGDFLVVILLYCLLKAFWNTTPFKAAMSVLAFSFLVEILQYFEVVKILGLQDSKLACIIIGTSFEWLDFLAYTAGIAVVLWLERSKMNV